MNDDRESDYGNAGRKRDNGMKNVENDSEDSRNLANEDEGDKSESDHRMSDEESEVNTWAPASARTVRKRGGVYGKIVAACLY